MYSAELSDLSVAELRSLLDTATGILQDLDKGNKTILRCRDTLARLLAEFDMSGNQGTYQLLLVRWKILFCANDSRCRPRRNRRYAGYVLAVSI